MIHALPRRRLLTTGTAGLATLATASCKKSADPATLTLGDQKGGMQSLLELSGQLTNLPYTIQWAQFPAAAPLFEAMNAGAIDAGIGGDAPFVFFLSSRPPAQAISALNYIGSGPAGGGPAGGGPAAAAILVRPGAGIQDIRGLAGKRVATVRGSTGQYITLAALQKAGLALDAVDFVFLEPSDSLTTLTNHGVDAWATWEPYVSVGELHYGLRPIALPQNLLAGLGFIVATDQAIAKKRDALLDYLARFSRARAWAAANQTAYASGFAKDTGLPPDVAAAYVRAAKYVVTPIDDRRIATVQALTDLYARAKLLPASFSVDFAFDKTFYAST